MIGGFLGAGKTTAIRYIARYLSGQGKRVGLITNDQSHGLVDTQLLRSDGFDTEEIGGGCFCCRFDSLVDAAKNLTRQSRPDVFLAEPVGSCTDLKATVDFPLREMYGDQFSIVPFSVLVDPIRALRLLGIEEGKSFSKNVRYIYLKQLEEADVIVINKIDLLDDSRLLALQEALATRFTQAKILTISARQGKGLEEWVDFLFDSDQSVPVPTLDYQRYGDGEAALGWLNTTIDIKGDQLFDGNSFLMNLAKEIQLHLATEEIAHLKTTLLPSEMATDLGVVNLVRSDASPLLSYALQDSIKGGLLTLNIRAQSTPELLEEKVKKSLAHVTEKEQLQFQIIEWAAFRPGKPEPTYRMTNEKGSIMTKKIEGLST